MASTIRAQGRQFLKLFELAEKRDTIAQELSRGMRQKVAMACAYLHDPRAILFDEPLTGLDPHGIRTLKAIDRRRAPRRAPRSSSARTCCRWSRICAAIC